VVSNGASARVQLAAWQAMASAEEAADCLAGVAATIAVAELGGAPPPAETRRRTAEEPVGPEFCGPKYIYWAVSRP
jgi:hypothetical protein